MGCSVRNDVDAQVRRVKCTFNLKMGLSVGIPTVSHRISAEKKGNGLEL
jgi:hypothetical protein